MKTKVKPVIELIAPGEYELTQDVDNPHPDRRQRYNWTLQETFPKGMRVVVKLPDNPLRDDPEVQQAHREWAPTVRLIDRLGRYSDTLRVGYAEVGDPKTCETVRDNARYLAIFPHLTPFEDDLGAVLKRNRIANSQDVLGRLIDAGKITLDDVEDAIAGVQDWDEQAWEEFNARHKL